MNLDPRKQTRKYKKRQLAHMKYGYAIILLCALFLPSYIKYVATDINTYEIFVNGTSVGVTDDVAVAQKSLIEARRQLAATSDELVLVEADLSYEGSAVDYGVLNTSEEMTASMKQVLEAGVRETFARCYSLKINKYIVNLSSTDDVSTLLQAALDKYQYKEDENGEKIAPDIRFVPVIDFDPARELSVLTADVVAEEKEPEEAPYDLRADGNAGIFQHFDEVFAAIEPAGEKDFDDYDQGLISMAFDDEIEIVECYLPKTEIKNLDKAIEEVTQDEAKPTIYEVVSGDTMSQIAEKVNIPMDDLLAMNKNIDETTLLIRPGDELTITVPQPKLSVNRTEQLYIEEDYEAEIVYVWNDEWYTTDTKTLQEPSAGHRNAIAKITYRNDDVEDTEYLKEEVTYQAVAKIVEKGTKIPPSYIKPISGGRLTSNFGRRKAPTRGASTYHKGIDWATPTGTAVVASSGGVVTKAGWGRGYGYVVYIQHPDGKVTRYGHLSKVLVSAGQSVSQGQKIALSGNTGVSTGPHLHFEILINGAQVNPLNYLN